LHLGNRIKMRMGITHDREDNARQPVCEPDKSRRIGAKKMSVATEAEAQAAAEAAAAAGNNPVLLGIPTFVVGGLTLGLFLLGYKPLGAAGPLLANITLVAGLGLLLATIWAIRIGAGAVAGIFGVFTGFWLSFAMLLFGIGSTVGLGVGAKLVAADAFSIYTLVWTIVAVVLTLATLRLPLVFTALIALVAIALFLVFLLYANGGTSTALSNVAGIVVLVFTALGIYIMFDAFSQALGGKAMPLGSPILK
jgi:uncharacterized protein